MQSWSLGDTWWARGEGVVIQTWHTRQHACTRVAVFGRRNLRGVPPPQYIKGHTDQQSRRSSKGQWFTMFIPPLKIASDAWRVTRVSPADGGSLQHSPNWLPDLPIPIYLYLPTYLYLYLPTYLSMLPSVDVLRSYHAHLRRTPPPPDWPGDRSPMTPTGRRWRLLLLYSQPNNGATSTKISPVPSVYRTPVNRSSAIYCEHGKIQTKTGKMKGGTPQCSSPTLYGIDPTLSNDEIPYIFILTSCSN